MGQGIRKRIDVDRLPLGSYSLIGKSEGGMIIQKKGDLESMIDFFKGLDEQLQREHKQDISEIDAMLYGKKKEAGK